MESRPYESMHDFYAMLDLLTEGCKADNGTHYVHRGDLQWWLFYTDTPEEIWRPNIAIWMKEDCLAGWALLSPDEHAFDVFVAPHLRGSSLEQNMLAWATDHMPALEYIQHNWVAED